MSAEHNDPPQTPPPGGGSPELVVIAKPEAGLRVRASGIASETGADTSSLESVLETHGAAIRPLFGLSEDRLRAQVEALPTPPGAKDDAGTEPPLDLALYYRVTADEDSLDQLAEELLADDLVEAAYVKPGGEPPSATLEGTVTATLNDMQPDPGDAPPATPSFVARQGHLAAAPGGVDAQFAWTLYGGRGTGIKIIDCEWAWRFTHEDLLQNQGGVVAGTSIGNTDHGTAVVGVIGGDSNSIGVTGIAPDAWTAALVVQRPVDLGRDQGGGRQARPRRHHPPGDSPSGAADTQSSAGPARVHRDRVVAGRLRRHPLRGAQGADRRRSRRQRVPEPRRPDLRHAADRLSDELAQPVQPRQPVVRRGASSVRARRRRTPTAPTGARTAHGWTSRTTDGASTCRAGGERSRPRATAISRAA